MFNIEFEAEDGGKQFAWQVRGEGVKGKRENGGERERERERTREAGEAPRKKKEKTWHLTEKVRERKKTTEDSPRFPLSKKKKKK